MTKHDVKENNEVAKKIFVEFEENLSTTNLEIRVKAQNDISEKLGLLILLPCKGDLDTSVYLLEQTMKILEPFRNPR